MSRWLPAALALIALTGTTVHFHWGSSGRGATSIHKVGLDDAFISYRYARSLASGHGPVFNEGERVEGFTNPAWVAIAAAIYPFVGTEDLHGAMVGVTALLLAGGCLGLWTVGRSLSPALARSTAAGLALSPLIWAWSTSGLETVAVVVSQLFLWFGIARLEQAGGAVSGKVSKAPRAALSTTLVSLFALCVLRSDGFLLAMFAVAYLIFFRVPARWLVARFVGAIVMSTFLARKLVFGAWLPNTYHAKVTADPVERIAAAFSQLTQLLTSSALIAPLAVIAAALLFRVAGKLPRSLDFALGFSMLTLGYWLWVGGDHFGERFLVALFPVGLAALVQIASLAPKARMALAGVGVTLYLGLQFFAAWSQDIRFSYSGDRYDALTELGTFLGRHHEGATLAVGAAGKIPFHSALRTIDMRGLTNAHIARTDATQFSNPGHDKSDVDHVLEQRPDLIAALVTTRDFDLAVGLDAVLYEEAGYQLRYLANVSRVDAGVNIVELASGDRSRDELNRLFDAGFRYGVLARTAPGK